MQEASDCVVLDDIDTKTLGNRHGRVKQVKMLLLLGSIESRELRLDVEPQVRPARLLDSRLFYDGFNTLPSVLSKQRTDVFCVFQ